MKMELINDIHGARHRSKCQVKAYRTKEQLPVVFVRLPMDFVGFQMH